MKIRFTISLLTLLLYPGMVWADVLVDAMSAERVARRGFGRQGNYYVAEFLKTKNPKTLKPSIRNRLMLNIRILRAVTEPKSKQKPKELQINRHNIGEVPKNKPVIVRANIMNNRCYLFPLGGYNRFGRNRKQLYWVDRGDPDGRYFKVTCELLFPQKDQLDVETFYNRLLELCSDKDSKIVDLATSYIGSNINIYAHPKCPEKAVLAFTDYILKEKDHAKRSKVAMFFYRAPLPQSPHKILSLLTVQDDKVTQAVVANIKKLSGRSEKLSPAFSQALLKPKAPKMRDHLLEGLIPWKAKGSALWPVIEQLTIGQQQLEVTQQQQALAAEVLVGINPQKAVASVRKSLPQIDSAVIYRFVYKQRMYDTVEVLVEKLRTNKTKYNQTIHALLAALTRKPKIGSDKTWIKWWDDLKTDGTAKALIDNQFIPIGKESKEIDDNIVQLGADDYKTRRAAQMRLFNIGPVANPKLETALKNPDQEIRIVADQLLGENK